MVATCSSLQVRHLCAVLVLVFLVALIAEPAFAGGSGLQTAFASVHGKVATVFTWIRNILFLVAGMALIAVAASAYAGRFNIKWFVTVLVSVVLIAINGALTDYFVDSSAGSSGGTATSGKMADAIR